MNTGKQPDPTRGHFDRRLRQLLLVALCAVTLAPGAAAQQVLIPIPSIPSEPEPPPPENADANQPEATGAAPAPPYVRPEKQPFQWGQFTLRPHMAYQFVYGQGIQSQPGQALNTTINQLSPGMSFDLGSRWKLDYTPTFLFYSDAHFRNTLDHAVTLAGSTSYNDWTLGLSQACALTSDPQIQTGQQTDQQTYLTSLTAAYRINTETSVELNAGQNFQSVQGFTDAVGSSRDWSTLDWLNYQWAPNLGAAGGVGFGYTGVDVGANMTYEQLRGRLTWHVLRKVNLSINGGAEIRQFLDSSQSDRASPVFGASIDYWPFEVTAISLSANRNVTASYYQNLATDSTVFNANISQRFFERVFLGLSGGYAHATYQTTGSSGSDVSAAGREDNYSLFSVSLNTAFLKRGTASVFYSASRNSSNQSGFGYSSDQLGFQIAYRY